MKRIFALFLIISNLFIMCVTATGDTNMDGGGNGGMNGGDTGGSDRSFWNPGDEGVRLTLVDVNNGYAVTSSIDYSNKQPKVDMHFGKTSKMYYCRISESVQPSTSQYHAYTPAKDLPTMISSTAGGNASIEAIRSYFSSEGALKIVASHLGFNYEEMISGKYKLVVEPIAYFTFHNIKYAMTATEAAVYDKMSGGKLRAKMVSLTHKNLPLALFLQRSDLNFPAFSGDSNSKQSNDTIIQQLGLGIVTFKPQEVPPPEVEEQEPFDYLTDTDVMTSVTIGSISACLPEDDKQITFRVHNENDKKNEDDQFYSGGTMLCPAGQSAMIWFRWHTPKEPCTVTIEILESPDFVPIGVITANIIDLEENEPPDPKFKDKNNNYTVPMLPDWMKKDQLETSWFEWFPLPLSGGGYEWYFIPHYARLEIDYELKPAERVKTATKQSGKYKMKSGYGVEAQVKVKIKAWTPQMDVVHPEVIPERDLIPVQHIISYFPEFDYKTYNRFLVPKRWSDEEIEKGKGTFKLDDTWVFKPNRFSYYKDPVHFTPLWYPDYKEYTVPAAVFSAWTPGGQLYATVSDDIDIKGTIYDDWYIHNIE